MTKFNNTVLLIRTHLLSKLAVHVLRTLIIIVVSCIKQSPQIWMLSLVAQTRKPRSLSDQPSALDLGNSLQSFLVSQFHIRDQY